MYKFRGGKKKREPTDTEAEDANSLLVFGYSCRLYVPTDETPADPTIPWNGDDSVKIDRYDCRLYLNSLDEFDGPRRSSESEDPNLSMEERLEEEICNEERYLDLHDAIRKAEENEQLKRGKGAEFAFSYDERDSTSVTDDASSSSEEEVEEPYAPPPELKLPVGMDLPETMKQSAIIERTASFVVSKGPQMEIVIKAKQRNDAAQFGFLEFDNRLNPFYKYICKLIREKKYTPKPVAVKTRPKPKKLRRLEEEQKKEMETQSPTTSNALKMIAIHHGSESEEEEDDEDGEDGYLHPLLRVKAAMKTDSRNNGSESNRTIGPMPRPAPVEPPAPDFNELLSKLQEQVATTDNVYSSLYKNLNSIIPSSKKSEAECKSKEANDGFVPDIKYETDEAKIKEYNDWHLSFYNKPSPFLPNGPPIPLPPPPNMSSALGIAARYVAMNGCFAEQRLIEHNGDNCSFLMHESPYYTYYQMRIRQTQWTLSQAYLSSVPLAEAQRNNNEAVVTPSLDYPDPPKPPSSLIPANNTSGLVPVEMTVNNAAGQDGEEDSGASPESALKRERRERARLFMEKILNEKLAAKKRQRDGNDSDMAVVQPQTTSGASGEDKPINKEENKVAQPKISSQNLSELINAKIEHVFTSSPLLAPVSVKSTTGMSHSEQDTPKASKHDDDRRRHRSRSRDDRRRKRSRSGSRSDDSYERRRRHGKRRKSPKKHSSRRRSRSRSDSYSRRRSP